MKIPFTSFQALILALFLILVTAQSAQAESAAKKNSKASVKAKKSEASESWPQTVENVKIKKWSMPKFKPHKKYSGYYFLNFDQIAQLEFSKRVEYIALMRKTAVEIEKFQFMFKNSTVNDASYDALKNEKSLYAILFGSEPAVAQGEPRECIYGGYVSTYEPSPDGQYRPFTCQIAKPCGNGGQRCNYQILGIPSSDSRSCIPRKDRSNATLRCDDLRRKLSAANDDDIVTAIGVARSQFNTDLSRGKYIKKEDLAGSQAALALRGLAENIYDDRAMAVLVQVLAVYKSAGIRPPVDDILKDIGDNNQLLQDMVRLALGGDNLAKATEEFQESVGRIFNRYVSHCESETPPEIINQIKSEEVNPKILKQSGLQIRDEMSRRVLARKIMNDRIKRGEISGTQDRFKNEDVLEYNECLRIRTRVKSINDQFKGMAATLPNVGSEQVVVPPAPALPAPPPVPVKNPKVESVGCNDTMTAEKHHLYAPAARCLACLAEKQKLKSENPGYADGAFQKPYNISTKWLSLLSTMAVACVDGVSNNSNVRFDTMLNYIQTFGHCSAEEYSWPEGEAMPEDQQKLIEIWSKQNMFLNQDPDNKEMADRRETVDDDFQKVYGISYNKAAQIFCDNSNDNSRFKTGWFTGRIKKLNDDYKKPSPSEELSGFAKRRSNFAKYLENPTSSFFKTNEGPNGDYVASQKDPKVANGLWTCMNESMANAKQLYSGNKNTCSKFVEANGLGLENNDFLEMAKDVVGVPGRGTTVAVQSSGTDCKSAHAVESFTRKDGKTRIGIQMVDSTYYNDPTRRKDIEMEFWTDKNGVPTPDAQVYASGANPNPGTKYQEKKIGWRLENYALAVPSNQCAVLAGGRAAGYANPNGGQSK